MTLGTLTEKNIIFLILPLVPLYLSAFIRGITSLQTFMHNFFSIDQNDIIIIKRKMQCDFKLLCNKIKSIYLIYFEHYNSIKVIFFVII